jgi:hypothetical protein
MYSWSVRPNQALASARVPVSGAGLARRAKSCLEPRLVHDRFDFRGRERLISRTAGSLWDTSDTRIGAGCIGEH